LREIPSERVLVFTRTKHRAKSLALKLERTGRRVAALQGNMAQNQRLNAINGFRDGRYDVLVATDIAARGIDVEGISHVVNFDVPDTVDAYTHRIGRTGRVDRTGEAFTLATQADGLMVRDIERVLGAPIERRRLPDFDYGTFSPDAQPQRSRPGASRPGRSFRPRSPVRRSPARTRTAGAAGYSSREPHHAGAATLSRPNTGHSTAW